MRTLRWRLTFWYGGMAAAILIILASVLYLSIRASLLAIQREDVEDTAASASQILEETGSPKSAVGDIRQRDVRTVWAIGEVRRPDVQVVIRGPNGNVRAATSDVEDPPEVAPSDAVYPEVRQDGRYLATTFESENLPGMTGEVYTVLPSWDPRADGGLRAEACGAGSEAAQERECRRRGASSGKVGEPGKPAGAQEPA